MRANHDGETPLYVDIILAADDYSNFIEMMKTYKTKLAEMAAGKEGVAEGDGSTAGATAGTGDSAQ